MAIPGGQGTEAPSARKKRRLEGITTLEPGGPGRAAGAARGL